MSVIPKLASALGQREQTANVLLAKNIVLKKDKKAVEELVKYLGDSQRAIRYDCIKVLYEIGQAEPVLIQEYYATFITLLDNKDNRMQWGAMTALDFITLLRPEPVFKSITKIIEIADNGSVITRDHCVNILISLSKTKKYIPVVFPLLLEQMAGCPVNQLPMYAEKSMSVIDKAHIPAYISLLAERMKETDQESKRKRIEKVLSKLKR